MLSRTITSASFANLVNGDVDLESSSIESRIISVLTSSHTRITSYDKRLQKKQVHHEKFVTLSLQVKSDNEGKKNKN